MCARLPVGWAGGRLYNTNIRVLYRLSHLQSDFEPSFPQPPIDHHHRRRTSSSRPDSQPHSPCFKRRVPAYSTLRTRAPTQRKHTQTRRVALARTPSQRGQENERPARRLTAPVARPAPASWAQASSTLTRDSRGQPRPHTGIRYKPSTQITSPRSTPHTQRAQAVTINTTSQRKRHVSSASAAAAGSGNSSDSSDVGARR